MTLSVEDVIQLIEARSREPGGSGVMTVSVDDAIRLMEAMATNGIDQMSLGEFSAQCGAGGSLEAAPDAVTHDELNRLRMRVNELEQFEKTHQMMYRSS